MSHECTEGYDIWLITQFENLAQNVESLKQNHIRFEYIKATVRHRENSFAA